MKTGIIVYASLMVESSAPMMEPDTQKLISAFTAHSSFRTEENLTSRVFKLAVLVRFSSCLNAYKLFNAK